MKIIAVFLILVIATASSSLYYFYRTRTDNVSQDPRFADIYQQRFELLQDMFVYQFPDSDEYRLQGPPFSSFLPASIQDYQNDPQNWPYTDAHAKKGWGKQNNYLKATVVQILKKGTRFKVVKILQVDNPFAVKRLVILAEVDGDEAPSRPINIVDLAENTYEVSYRDIKLRLNSGALAKLYAEVTSV